MDGTPLDLHSLQSSTIADSMYVLPFVDSFLRRNINQRVALCTPTQYRHIRDTHKHGIDISSYNSILAKESTSVHTILCLNDCSMINQRTSYYGYTRYFAGKSPPH